MVLAAFSVVHSSGVSASKVALDEQHALPVWFSSAMLVRWPEDHELELVHEQYSVPVVVSVPVGALLRLPRLVLARLAAVSPAVWLLLWPSSWPDAFRVSP